MARAYFSVLIKDEKGDKGAIVFGDYDRTVANEEAQIYKEAGIVYAVKVIKTAPNSEAIEAAVATLNA